MEIRPEKPEDIDAIREVNRQAFGQEDEGQLVDALRREGYARVSLVADEAGQLVGHILFSELPISTDAGTTRALALAPMAVVPARQRKGIGSQLIQAGLAACRKDGHRIVVVVGHPAYYPRFGFSAHLAEPLQAPFSGPAFMALELVPAALAGIGGEVRYPPPFGLDLPTP